MARIRLGAGVGKVVAQAVKTHIPTYDIYEPHLSWKTLRAWRRAERNFHSADKLHATAHHERHAAQSLFDNSASALHMLEAEAAEMSSYARPNIISRFFRRRSGPVVMSDHHINGAVRTKSEHHHDGTALTYHHQPDGRLTRVEVKARGYDFNSDALRERYKGTGVQLVLPQAPPGEHLINEKNLSRSMRKRLKNVRRKYADAVADLNEKAQAFADATTARETAARARDGLKEDLGEMSVHARPGVVEHFLQWSKHQLLGGHRIPLKNGHTLEELYDKTKLLHFADGRVAVLDRGHAYSRDKMWAKYKDRFIGHKGPKELASSGIVLQPLTAEERSAVKRATPLHEPHAEPMRAAPPAAAFGTHESAPRRGVPEQRDTGKHRPPSPAGSSEPLTAHNPRSAGAEASKTAIPRQPPIHRRDGSASGSAAVNAGASGTKTLPESSGDSQTNVPKGKWHHHKSKRAYKSWEDREQRRRAVLAQGEVHE